MDAELSEELDEDVAQDELLARGGLYEVGPVAGTGWKFLLGIGIVLTGLGIVLVLGGVLGWIPLPSSMPSPFGTALILAVLAVGVVCLGAGAALRASVRRGPERLKPIV